jgi:hypothetical protein
VSYRHPYQVQKERRRAGENTPVTIPLFTYFHSRRTEECHDHAFHKMNQVLNQQIPQFAARNKIMISDREFKGPFFPNTQQASCWLHFSKNLEYNAREVYHLPQDDRKKLQNNLYALLKSSSLENYEARKQQFFREPHWTPDVQRYFNKHMYNDIKTKGAAYYLEEIGIENPKDGLTNNAAESLNNKYRKMKISGQASTKAELMVNMKILDDNWHMETVRAYYGEGQYEIFGDEYKTLKKHV